MLGQLLHSFNPTRQRIQRLAPLESQTEEAHTQSLLFPDSNVLNQPSSLSDSLPGDAPLQAANPVNATDCGVSDIDLETPRDVRIILAQNFTGQQDVVVLHDSWSAARVEPQEANGGNAAFERGPKSPATAPPTRRSSIVSSDSGRRSPSSFSNNGAFHQRSRLRNTSVSSSLPFIDETAPAKARDDPVRTTALECMFENAQSSYKGTSNRIHVIPLEARPNETVLSSPTFADGPTSLSSIGKLAGSRRSHLATSYTPGETVPVIPRSDGTRTPRTPARENRRRTVLISRTFSVPWVEEGEGVDASNEATPTQSNPNPDSNSYPFPKIGSSPRRLRLLPAHGGSRTLPMYGICIVLQLPVAPSGSAIRRNQSGYFPPMPHGTDSIASSLGSDGRMGSWSFIESALGAHSMMTDSFSSDVDDKVDLVGQHWDVIARSLTALQFLAQEKILTMLEPQSGAFRPQLPPGALSLDSDVKYGVDSTCRRLVRGFKIPRVRTGQGRWGIWREEALWLTRWTSGKEPEAFVLRLLTAFLGQHTEWMRILGPDSYRRQYREQQDSKHYEDLTLPARTVIVADNKMAARRMIFLLAAFLPSTHQVHGAMSPTRPGTAASLRAYSQSPPGTTSLSRQQSLRRTINRRGKTSASRTRQPGRDGQNGGRYDLGDDRALSGDDLTDHISHIRRGSDARSILGTPLQGSVRDEVTRKSSTATTATVTPETAVPAAHFATHRNSSSRDFRSLHHRPGSSGSLASANLANALQRDHTGGSTESANGGSRWGSLTSFWSSSSRRESSTDYSDVLQSTDEGLGILSLNGSRLAQSRSSNKLEQMVQEAEATSARSSMDGLGEHLYNSATDHQSPDIFPADGDDQEQSPRPSTAQPTTHRHEGSGSPFKMSVSASGVIDVQIPFPEFTGWPPARPPYLSAYSGHDLGQGGHHRSASLNSTASNSPNHAHPPLLTPQLPLPSSTESVRPLNVAGWLTYLHADFVLQAVKPYAGLLQDIKAAMSAEPTPPSPAKVDSLDLGPTERWVDIGSCLIADTRTWTLKRLTLRRLVRLMPVLGQPAVTPGVTPGAAPLGMSSRGAAERAASHSRHRLPFDAFGHGKADHGGPTVVMSEIHLREEWREEIVTDVDDTLIEALGRVVDGAAPVSQSSRSTSSSSTTPPHDSTTETPVHPTTATAHSPPQPTAPTVSAGMAPRDTERAILGALEKVVAEVVVQRRAEIGEPLQPGDFETAVRLRHMRASVLRQGVGRWLAEVEEGSAATATVTTF